MDLWIIEYLSLPLTSQIAVALVLTVLRGGVAGMLLRVDTELRRAPYLMVLAGISLGVALLQLGWAYVPDAAQSGMLSVLFLAMMGVNLLAGMFVYWASAARSNDMIGETSKAWMGFVPLVNLVLLFTPGESGVGRSRVARWVLDPLIVVLALAVFAVSRGAEESILNSVEQASIANPGWVQYVTESMTVEDSFAFEERTMRSNLPIRLNAVTLLTRVEAEGAILRMEFEVEGEDSFLPDDLAELVAQEQCRSDMFGRELRQGGEIEYRYSRSDGRFMDRFTITGADC